MKREKMTRQWQGLLAPLALRCDTEPQYAETENQLCAKQTPRAVAAPLSDRRRDRAPRAIPGQVWSAGGRAVAGCPGSARARAGGEGPGGVGVDGVVRTLEGGAAQPLLVRFGALLRHPQVLRHVRFVALHFLQ